MTLSASQLVREGASGRCRVCGCAEPKAAPDLCGACAAVSGHVITMTLDHSGSPSISVATCACGWVSRVPFLHGHGRAQDAAIHQHWRLTIRTPRDRGREPSA